MSNPAIKQITLPSGTTYDLVDQGGRELIAQISGTKAWLGITTTALTDGATTNPITIDGESITAVAGNMTAYGEEEFIFNGTKWQAFGDLSDLGDLAYKDSATVSGSCSVTPSGTIETGSGTANYTPAGTNASSSVSGTCSVTPSGTIGTGSGTANYTPAGSNGSSSVSGSCSVTPSGSVSAPTISVDSAGSTTTVNSITDVGTLPSFTVANEVLTLSAGTLPTKGSDTTVKTGDASYTASAPTFTGSASTGTISGTAEAQTFTGTGVDLEFTGSASTGTISGTASAQTFTGTGAELKFAGTASTGTISGTAS